MQRIATSLPYTELEVADGNFDISRSPIDRIIIHTMVGTWQGAAARFDDPASKVSAHYGVKLDGTYIHWLEEFNTAYHAGDYPMNQRSIGIEHEDGWNGQPPEPTRPDVLYTASARLVKDIATFYNIPIDRQHILKHSEVSDQPTGCPDSLDIDRIVKEAAALPTASPAPTGGVLPPNYDDIVRKSSLYDLFNASGYATVDAVKNIIDNLTQARDNAQNSYEAEVEKTTALTQANTDLAKANTSLKFNVSAVTKQNTDLLGKLQEQSKTDSTAIDEGLIAEQNYNQISGQFKDLAQTLQVEPNFDAIKARVNSLVAIQKQQEPVLQNKSRFELWLDTILGGK